MHLRDVEGAPGGAEAAELERALRRTCAAMVVDPAMTARALRAQLQATILGSTAGLPARAALLPT